MLCANEPTPRIITLAADFRTGILRGIFNVTSVSQIRRQRNAKKSDASTSRRSAGKIISMADEISQRMEKLESHLAHLEHQVEQLNEVVTDQGKLVEFLKKQVQRQSGVLETMELERIKDNNPRPPHHQ
jgi:SlyX protein